MTSSTAKEALAARIKALEDANQRLEEKLAHYQRNEERFQALLRSTRDGYFETNLKGDLVFLNDAVCAGLGYTREELLGKNNREYTSPDSARYMYQVFTQVYETGLPAKISDYEVIRKDGEHRFLELSAYLLHDANGEPVGFGGVSRDITDRKRSEQALKESEERFRLLQEATFGAICIHENGRIIDCNAELCRMSGYAYKELLGMDSTELCAPEWRPVLKKAVFFDQSGQNDLVGLRKDGKRMPVEVRSKTIPYQGKTVRVDEYRDITARKNTEEALRKSRVRYRQLYKEAHQAEELYQSLLDSSPDAIVLVNADQLVQYINSAFSRLFGWTLSTLQKKTLPYIPRLQRERFGDMIDALLETGEPVNGKETQALTQDGRFLDVSLSAARYLDYKGYPAGALIILRDITEAKRYQWHMHQAQKMESIGAMAGGIAHDFNNLLMGIQGRLSLATMQVEPHSALYTHLKEIEDYSLRAADLTRKLLGIARIDKGEIVPADINDLVHTQDVMFGRTCKELTFHEDLAEDLWPAEVDPRQIDQVLLNMYVNAFHAMPDGGDLYVQTRNEYLSPDRTQPHDVEPGNYIKISVTDTGVGMDKAVQRRIFEPFFTTKPGEQGTGLGLASAYSIIKHHGGFIILYSEKGKGSTFNIYLPAASRPAEAPLEVSNEILSGRGTILLVDDEEMIVNVGKEMLQAIGYDVIAASGGRDAVARLTEAPAAVDAVILDLVMPGMNGGATFDELRAIRSDIKVLLSSGYSFNSQAASLMQRGCRGFIQKPFNLGELSRKLDEILNGTV